MNKTIFIVMIIIFTIPVSSFAQFQQGDTELTLLGTITHLSGDRDHFFYYSQTIISLSAGFGRFVSPTVQIGIKPTWEYIHVKYAYSTYPIYEGGEREASKDDGAFGVSLFANFNLPSKSKTVPYLSVQYQITDVAPEGGADFADMSFLGLGGGLRYFVVEKAAINSTLLYSIPLKDAEYKYKTLSLFLGLSIIL